MDELLSPSAVPTPAAALSFPRNIPDWLQREVGAYDLPFLTPPRTVLDLGANLGAFIHLALQRWPEARIAAYEPAPENHAALLESLRNVTGTVEVFQMAVRHFSGAAEFFRGDRPVTGGFHQLGRQTRERQLVTCIDAAELESCEFVKVDTEGCEVEIISRLDLSWTRAVAVEYHRADDYFMLQGLCLEQGFDIWQDQPQGRGRGLLVFARPGVLRPNAEARGAASEKVSTGAGAGSTGHFPARPLAPSGKAFIALPVYGALDVCFTQSLLKLVNDPPVPLLVRMHPGDSLVSRARNTLTADFLESDATHLLFIDTDLIFSAEQVARLMRHPQEIVGGFYPKKQEGEVQWVCNGSLTPTPPRPDGLQEVRYLGTGFLRIHRCVFERMIEAHGPELFFKPDERNRVEYDFWSTGIFDYPDGSRRYLSEDWYFCQRALDLGFKVWGDTRIVLKHVGPAIYPLQSQQQQLFGAPASAPASDRATAPAVPPPVPVAREFQPAPRPA